MNTQRLLPFLAAPVLAVVVTGCPAEENVTTAEALTTVDESSNASQASNLAEGTIELSTSFTLGGALADVAGQVKAFIATELPCATVTAADATLTVDYGTKAGTCTWHGHTITGEQTISIVSADATGAKVHHEWKDVSNGRVTVNGSADVTWDTAAKSRHVTHQLTWTLADGKTGTGSGDRTQSALGGDWKSGVHIDGQRSWDGPRGHWALGIVGVDWRWQDPVPQSGEYTVTTPDGKELTLVFSRVDDNTIKVSLEGATKNYSFNVSSVGEVGSSGT